MKRCPECEFLYENESSHCEMDGTPLRYTVKLPTLPGLAQSIWDKWTIALLIGVVVLTVLAILYRATPRAYTSPGHAKSVKLETPAVNQSPPSADSAAPPESTATQSATDDSDSSNDPSESPSTTGTKAQKSKRGSQAVDEKEPTPPPAVHMQTAENPQALKASSSKTEPATTGETSASVTSVQKPASAATSSIHPTAPPIANKATPLAEKKDSGFKSVLKKAGKILKKPFGEN